MRELTSILDPVILSLAVALGIGLLIGTERERRKGEGPDRSPAGLRTFALASITGASSFIVGGDKHADDYLYRPLTSGKGACQYRPARFVTMQRTFREKTAIYQLFWP